MNVRLYSSSHPHGRCLLFAQRLSQVANVSTRECLRIAEELFAFQHPPNNPVVLGIVSPNSLKSLEETCKDFGITMEVDN